MYLYAGVHPMNFSSAIACTPLSGLSEEAVGGLSPSRIHMHSEQRHLQKSTIKIITWPMTKNITLTAFELRPAKFCQIIPLRPQLVCIAER